MSRMLEVFLPKAWLVAHQAGNDDKIRQAMAEQVRQGMSLNITPNSNLLGAATLVTAKPDKGNSI